ANRAIWESVLVFDTRRMSSAYRARTVAQPAFVRCLSRAVSSSASASSAGPALAGVHGVDGERAFQATTVDHKTGLVTTILLVFARHGRSELIIGDLGLPTTVAADRARIARRMRGMVPRNAG